MASILFRERWVKQKFSRRDQEVGSPLIHLLLAGLSSHSDNALYTHKVWQPIYDSFAPNYTYLNKHTELTKIKLKDQYRVKQKLTCSWQIINFNMKN